MSHANLTIPTQHRTIDTSCRLTGIGLHSGEAVELVLHPAPAGHGLTLFRRDLRSGEGLFNLSWNNVIDTSLRTRIGNGYGHSVATVEHLLSALAGLGVSDLKMELDGPELPAMDGSAAPFVAALQEAGLRDLSRLREVLVIRRPIRVQRDVNWVELSPSALPRYSITIDFAESAIGCQQCSLDLSPGSYLNQIAPARTFGFAEHIWQLHARGLALGGSVETAIVLREGRVLNRGGLRFRDEYARHKILDAVGDMALIGYPVIGHYRGYRPSHRLNNELLQLLAHDPAAWDLMPARQYLAELRRKPSPPKRPKECRASNAAGPLAPTVNKQRFFGLLEWWK